MISCFSVNLCLLTLLLLCKDWISRWDGGVVLSPSVRHTSGCYVVLCGNRSQQTYFKVLLTLPALWDQPGPADIPILLNTPLRRFPGHVCVWICIGCVLHFQTTNWDIDRLCATCSSIFYLKNNLCCRARRVWRVQCSHRNRRWDFQQDEPIPLVVYNEVRMMPIPH